MGERKSLTLGGTGIEKTPNTIWGNGWEEISNVVGGHFTLCVISQRQVVITEPPKYF